MFEIKLPKVWKSVTINSDPFFVYSVLREITKQLASRGVTLMKVDAAYSFRQCRGFLQYSFKYYLSPTRFFSCTTKLEVIGYSLPALDNGDNVAFSCDVIMAQIGVIQLADVTDYRYSEVFAAHVRFAYREAFDTPGVLGLFDSVLALLEVNSHFGAFLARDRDFFNTVQAVRRNCTMHLEEGMVTFSTELDELDEKGWFVLLDFRQDTGSWYKKKLRKFGYFEDEQRSDIACWGSPRGQIQRMHGRWDFVVTREGDIIASQQFGHYYLSNAKNVAYAGTIRFNHGQVTYWDNGSGHFKPPREYKEQAIKFPLDKFHDIGHG